MKNIKTKIARLLDQCYFHLLVPFYGAAKKSFSAFCKKIPGADVVARFWFIVLFLNNLTLSTFRHPILQARKGKNNYEKHYK